MRINNNGHPNETPPHPNGSTTETLAVQFDARTGRLVTAEGERQLTPKAAGVLTRLVRHPGRLVSRDELLHEVWPGTVVCDDVLSTTIYELRQALGDSAREPRFVETLRKRGYRWIAPSPVHPPAVQAPSHGSRRPTARWLAAAALAAASLGGLLTVSDQRPSSEQIAPVQQNEPSPEVCNLYLRAVRVASEGTADSARRAVAQLERAAALSPDWPAVHVALAESYLELASESAPALERARLAIELASAKGADASELLALRAALKLRADRDPEGARRDLASAREESSCGRPRIDLRTAEALSALGRHSEAIQLLEGLARSEPGSVAVQRQLGRALELGGRLAAAEERLVAAMELAPYHVPTLRRLAEVRAGLGDVQGSWEATRREAYALRVPAEGLAELERSWQHDGLDGVRRWRLANSETLQLGAVERAAVWVGLGDLDHAAEELRRAGSQQSPLLLWVAVDPVFAPLRDDDRYRRLVSELSRPQSLRRS